MKVVTLVVGAVLLFGVGSVAYKWCEIPRSRIFGKYEIDRTFYSGENANWQHEIYSFEITKDNEFKFSEKLKDRSDRDTSGKIHWYRNSPPHLFRIDGANSPLIDTHPSHYRCNCKFYFVFQTKYGNTFYRKSSS